MRAVILAVLSVIFASCGAQPKRPAPPEPVRYLPTPNKACIRQTPPADPQPPKCSPLDPSIPTKCSADQESEYLAQLLDHRESLVRWATLWFYLCGEGAKP